MIKLITTTLPENMKYSVSFTNFKEEGDFSIKENNGNLEMQVDISQNKIESLKVLSNYLLTKESTPLNLYIKKGDFSFEIDDAIEMYLLSYQYVKKISFNLQVSKKEEMIFNEIKDVLKNILTIKKEMCANDSDILREQLLGMYALFSPIAKRIIDKTYPKEEVISDNNLNLSDLRGKRVIIIDNHNFFYRNYHGMPDMRDNQGRPTAVIKALTTLLKDIEEQNPDFLIFANEGTKTVNVRKNIYSDYKVNRKETPDDLKFQIPACLDLLKEMGINIIEEEGYEADDIIASYAKAFSDAGASVQVHTSDKDLYQILAGDNNISILNPMTKKLITEEDCLKKFGVTFDKCLMVQAIMGDTSDDVPGIKGIGVKTAAELINQYIDLDNLYKNAESITGKKGEKIRDGEEDAKVSLQLVSLDNTLAKKEEMLKSVMPEKPLQKAIETISQYDINIL